MITHDSDSQDKWCAIPRWRQYVVTVLYLLVMTVFVIAVVKEFNRAVGTPASHGAPAAASAMSNQP